MPFLRGTTPIWGTQDLPGRFKEWKASLVEIGQTAHNLERNAQVQCYRSWYVETGYVHTILGKLHKLKHSILTRHNTYLGHTSFARTFQRMESLFCGNWANSTIDRDKCPCQFSHGRELGISMYGKWGEKHAHADIFVAHCGFQAQY